jgi:hypothetical protein
MDSLLDDNVKMKKLDDEGYHEGKAAVRDYFLTGQGKSDEARSSPGTRIAKWSVAAASSPDSPTS